jgi:hypothetical protein
MGHGKTLTPTRMMTVYRIIKWWPDKPTEKEPAAIGTFDDLAFAETVKKELEKDLPHRRFAIESLESREQAK